VLGVLGVFGRDPCTPPAFAWLRTFADHAAIAIAHARALAEIEQLRDQLELENTCLREEIRGEAPHGLIGESPALRKALDQLAVVAPTTASVLIEGESGTGKELVARAIHDLGGRRHRPLISVNCASIPRELFESEFFGHVKGAFTGALRDRAGRFQAADGGTLFLDEVGEIPFELQGKLLRVLQDGQFQRVGDDITRRVDVRVVAATNRNLKRDAASGRFREDLFYRLSVFPIALPPLRDRAGDVALLAAHSVEQAARRHGRRPPRLTARNLEALESYAWPGNVRELQHVIERAVLLSRGGALDVEGVLGDRGTAPRRGASATGSAAAPAVVPDAEWRRRERENLRMALQLADGRVYGADGAAERLGVKPTTLVSRLKALGLREPRARAKPWQAGEDAAR
jgi:transcriptional regulator with GAF, ATPase, and Fis domain